VRNLKKTENCHSKRSEESKKIRANPRYPRHLRSLLEQPFEGQVREKTKKNAISKQKTTPENQRLAKF